LPCLFISTLTLRRGHLPELLFYGKGVVLGKTKPRILKVIMVIMTIEKEAKFFFVIIKVILVKEILENTNKNNKIQSLAQWLTIAVPGTQDAK
jgi:hypothetical protein